MEHPFGGEIINKVRGMTAVLTMAVTLWFMMFMYSDMDIAPGIGMSLVYTLVFALCGYYYWYLKNYLNASGARAVVAAIIQTVCLTTSFTFISLVWPGNNTGFLKTLPMVLIFGILCWIILAGWYGILAQKEIAEEIEIKELTPKKGRDILDTITVKEGSRITIIKAEQLQYILAYGDYVMLYTEDNKHIKEQTMKYFESNLPSSFIRIHRSCIVNSDKIVRTEQYGKESYNIHLKSGAVLRASSAGYKLLKDKLAL